MLYQSTRGGSWRARFGAILLEGLAPDGGLAIPTELPRFDEAALGHLSRLPYPELAAAVLSAFSDDRSTDELLTLCRRAYTAERFGSSAITPVEVLEPGLALLRLSEGPTLAFKDVAMQLLGELFEDALARQGSELNILGATSGDTGSAAEYALRGRRGIRVFMLSPKGRMSPFQTAQMYSLLDPNIFNIAIEGVFDDAQDIVKHLGGDAQFKARVHLGTVNSINWARVAAQVVYYFRGYFAVAGRLGDPVSFAVPSGNFGNICAGHIARSMGLPIQRLVCATNENDVLDEFFRTGVYRVRKAAETHATSSPSMDISKASNFERFVFDLVGRDGARVAALWAELERNGRFDLSGLPAFRAIEARFGFVSSRSSHQDRIDTIRSTARRYGRVIDPHTADAMKGALAWRRPGETMVVLETAQPAKFAATIVEALGRPPELPPGAADLLERPQRFDVLPPDSNAVRRYLEARIGANASRGAI